MLGKWFIPDSGLQLERSAWDVMSCMLWGPCPSARVRVPTKEHVWEEPQHEKWALLQSQAIPGGPTPSCSLVLFSGS